MIEVLRSIRCSQDTGEMKMYDYRQIALDHAMISHEKEFDQKFGTRPVHDLEPSKLCFFNNSCIRTNLTGIDKRREKFLRRLDEIDIAAIAFAEYPDGGSQEGYSYAIILDAIPQMADTVLEIWAQVYRTVGWD